MTRDIFLSRANAVASGNSLEPTPLSAAFPSALRVGVTERRRKCEFAKEMRRLAEEAYPSAEKIRLALDNLSTHTAAFYEAFSPKEARRLARRVEFVYTPVRGSWLNMAEIEISALVRQCLGKRRLLDVGTLSRR